MNQIKEAFKNILFNAVTGFYWCDRVWAGWSYGTMTEDDFYPAEEDEDWINETVENIFKAANLLPTEKTCPECRGRKYGNPPSNVGGSFNLPCYKCKGTGKIQIYYTPEEFKTIMGYDYPDDAYVLVYLLGKWIFDLYGRILDEYKSVCVIVQTAQPAPEVDYEKEVIK